MSKKTDTSATGHAGYAYVLKALSLTAWSGQSLASGTVQVAKKC